MNMAAHMENSGLPGRAHLSEQTATQLKAAGKAHWLKPVDGSVEIKGKGLVQSYWLGATVDARASVTSDSMNMEIAQLHLMDDPEGKHKRLIDWQLDIFSDLLKQIDAHRRAVEKSGGTSRVHRRNSKVHKLDHGPFLQEGSTCLDEVKEIIQLPKFDPFTAAHQEDHESIELDPVVVEELRQYINTISMLYKENSFHNFEHACHVTQSVRKLLSRIVMPSGLVYSAQQEQANLHRSMASTLHDYTYGITSDPLTQFAVIFSALIHDVRFLR